MTDVASYRTSSPSSSDIVTLHQRANSEDAQGDGTEDQKNERADAGSSVCGGKYSADRYRAEHEPDASKKDADDLEVPDARRSHLTRIR